MTYTVFGGLQLNPVYIGEGTPAWAIFRFLIFFNYFSRKIEKKEK